MRLKPLRLLAAVITTIITTWIGLSAINSGALAAEEAVARCTQSDISVYHDLMQFPEEEATPDYVLAVSEAFLKTCSGHPDARNIRLQAAEAALNTGAAQEAVEHLGAAQTYGYKLLLADRFKLMAALAATGREDEAWVERDVAVEAWLARLEDDGLATIDEMTLTHGTVYEIQFSEVEPETRIRSLWFAVPSGDGWPATVTLGSDSFRAAMHAIRANEDAERLQHVDFVRCRSRYTLGKSEGEIDIASVEKAARPLLEAYLQSPDQLERTGERKPVAACIWPGRMMPQPDPWTTITLN